MTPEEWANRLRKNADAIINTDKLILLSVGSALSKMAPRIFKEGRDVNGGTRQYNQTKGLYVEDSALPKSGGNKGKTGKSIKTNYFSSYQALHNKMGIQPRTPMTFRLTRELQSDLLNSSVAQPDNAKVKKIDNLTAKISINRTGNQKKANGLESRFGTKIFELSRSEIKTFRDSAAFEYRKMLQA